MQHHSPIAQALILALVEKEQSKSGEKIVVNPLVAKVATWYEKFRNVMEYREEEVILRATIERILKRRTMLGGTGKTVAEPLIRELVWAHYFPDNSLSESLIEKVRDQIDLFLKLKELILSQRVLSEHIVTEWMFNLLSSSIGYDLNPSLEKELVSNLMFHLMKEQVVITDDSEQNKDVQVFIAIRRAFARDDRALLRYHLFYQIFGEVRKDNVENIASRFSQGYKEIQGQLSYPRKDRIFMYIKNRTAVFLILEDLLRSGKENVRVLLENREELDKAVLAACEVRYNTIAKKVKRAIIRSVLFVLISKAFFALSVEGSFESMVYGKIQWRSLLINTSIPPFLMVAVSFFIRTPGKDNSKRILSYITSILFDEKPKLGAKLVIQKTQERKRPLLYLIFSALWMFTYLLSFGLLVFILTKLQFTLISQGIFLFFLAIVSFLSYRIGLMSRVYTIEEKQGLITPMIDFFFMPVVRVGRELTEGIAQINILLFVLDFIIETPFKGIFGFFEEWFFYLHSKRENLG